MPRKRALEDATSTIAHFVFPLPPQTIFRKSSQDRHSSLTSFHATKLPAKEQNAHIPEVNEDSRLHQHTRTSPYWIMLISHATHTCPCSIPKLSPKPGGSGSKSHHHYKPPIDLYPKPSLMAIGLGNKV